MSDSSDIEKLSLDELMTRRDRVLLAELRLSPKPLTLVQEIFANAKVIQLPL